MAKIGSKFMFSTGIFVTGVSAILFGTLNWSRPGTTFLTLSLILRITESIGAAAFKISCFAIACHAFPGRIMQTIGTLEVFIGLGLMSGPAIGGGLYELGGYGLPFYALGGLLIIGSVLSIMILDSYPDDSQRDSQGILGLAKKPSILLAESAVLVCSMSLLFMEATLAPHLIEFHLTPFHLGLIFLLAGGVYSISAPICGHVVDRWRVGQILTIIGAFIAATCFMFIGPSPLLPLKKTLWLIAPGLAVWGIGTGTILIPSFQTILGMAKTAGYPDTIETFGCVSGFFFSGFTLGGFIGPTVGALLVESITFEWTATLISGIFLTVGIMLLLHYVFTHGCKRAQSADTQCLIIDETEENETQEDLP